MHTDQRLPCRLNCRRQLCFRCSPGRSHRTSWPPCSCSSCNGSGSSGRAGACARGLTADSGGSCSRHRTLRRRPPSRAPSQAAAPPRGGVPAAPQGGCPSAPAAPSAAASQSPLRQPQHPCAPSALLRIANVKL